MDFTGVLTSLRETSTQIHLTGVATLLLLVHKVSALRGDGWGGLGATVPWLQFLTKGRGNGERKENSQQQSKNMAKPLTINLKALALERQGNDSDVLQRCI